MSRRIAIFSVVPSLAVFASASAFAKSSKPFHSTVAADFLTRAQERDIINALDDVASDSWDESDDQVVFYKLRCQKSDGQCQITFRLESWLESTDETWDSPVVYCTFKGLKPGTAKAVNDRNEEIAHDAFDKCFSTVSWDPKTPTKVSGLPSKGRPINKGKAS